MASSMMVARIAARKSTVSGKSVRAAGPRAAVARTATVRVVARDAPWCPGSPAPSYLDGKLPGCVASPPAARRGFPGYKSGLHALATDHTGVGSCRRCIGTPQPQGAVAVER